MAGDDKKLPTLGVRSAQDLGIRPVQTTRSGQVKLPSLAKMRQALQAPFKAREMTAFDPAMGRGYRIGNQVNVPAGSGFNGIPAVTVVNHGAADVVSRWKVTVYVRDPNGSDTPQLGSRLRIVTLSKMENDTIPRRCTVSLNDAQVIYAPGRSLQVLAFNPMPFDLVVEYNLDEVTAGLSRWEDVEYLSFDPNTLPLCDGVVTPQPINPPTGLPAHDPFEVDLDIPPFCSGFTVYSNQISPAYQSGPILATGMYPNAPILATGMYPNAPILRGYGQNGTLVFQDILLTPRSGFIDRVPGLDYTIRPFNPVRAGNTPLTNQANFDEDPVFGDPIEYALYYSCDG